MAVTAIVEKGCRVPAKAGTHLRPAQDCADRRWAPAFAGAHGICSIVYPTVVPSSDPIAIVAAIAIAPQKVTRTTGRSIGALPPHAPSAPRIARKTSDAAATVQGSDGP